MSTTTEPTALADARVELWRFERLRAAHCPTDTAMALATRQDVDLHAAIGLLAVGCPPGTALEILL
jgi:hypothetical protein